MFGYVTAWLGQAVSPGAGTFCVWVSDYVVEASYVTVSTFYVLVSE